MPFFFSWMTSSMSCSNFESTLLVASGAFAAPSALGLAVQWQWPTHFPHRCGLRSKSLWHSTLWETILEVHLSQPSTQTSFNNRNCKHFSISIWRNKPGKFKLDHSLLCCCQLCMFLPKDSRAKSRLDFRIHAVAEKMWTNAKATCTYHTKNAFRGSLSLQANRPTCFPNDSISAQFITAPTVMTIPASPTFAAFLCGPNSACS